MFVAMHAGYAISIQHSFYSFWSLHIPKKEIYFFNKFNEIFTYASLFFFSSLFTGCHESTPTYYNSIFLTFISGNSHKMSNACYEKSKSNFSKAYKFPVCQFLCHTIGMSLCVYSKLRSLKM